MLLNGLLEMRRVF